MSSDDKRPPLRAMPSVDPVPKATAAQPPPPTATKPVLPEPAEPGNYKTAISSVDPESQIASAYLAAIGCRISDGVSSIYDEISTYAPAGTFRNGHPPGIEQAKASRIWIKKQLDKAKENRQVPAEAKEAALAAGSELEKAWKTARRIGPWFDERCATLYREAIEDAREITNFLSRQSPIDSDQPTEKMTFNEVYIFGADVLGHGIDRG